ncbi:methyltransferase [Dokdonella sp.]|uniref:class I SAM-dependent methyltransferase n=1 Tax=Dokdonella sp. TaxID=2291710 RepID=UPI0027B8BF70|nr:methyltransferase [Dokdonella sp.]
MNKFISLLPLALALAACGSNDAPAPTANVPVHAPELDQPAQPTPPQSAQESAVAKLDRALAGDWRSESNKARDPYRHPKETLEFFGVKPSDTLIEITPGAGWYTEVLAPFLKDSGHFIAAAAADASSDYAKSSNEAYRALLQKDEAAFGKVAFVEFDPKAPVLGAADSADTVLTFRNVHNWAMGGNAPAMFKAFFAVLKPGGTLGVVDHRAAAGAAFDKVKDSGYLPQDYVIKLATDAGFKLEAQSEINANPADTKDHAKGVWTLPPTYALGDEDHAKYQAIGESDRMTLKFVKPGADGIFKTKD